jgi:predicted anti-sigma-YlaC factor YlaD
MDMWRDDDTLKRLLGPAEPELLCDECFEKLDEYVELELEGAQADDRIPGMRAHLAGCPACREDYDSLRELVENEPTEPR